MAADHTHRRWARCPGVPQHAIAPDVILDAFANWREIEAPLNTWHRQQRHTPRPRGDHFTEAFLLRAIQHPREFYRLRAAELGQRSPAVMAVALGDRSARVRRLGAESVVAPPGSLAGAASDRSVAVRAAVASNPSTPRHVVVSLLDDREVEVARAAARQPGLPPRVLWRLARAGDATMRSIVAGHGAPHELLAHLASDPCAEVTLAVAANPSTPGHVLADLARHHGDIRHGQVLASHPNTPTDVLDRLARHGDEAVWMALVTNPRTTADTLERIPTGLRPRLHRLLARHMNAPRDLCRRVAHDYVQSCDPTLRGIGLSLVFRGPATVLPAGAGRTTAPVPDFREPVDVLAWLADGGDLLATQTYAALDTTPAWLRRFLHSQMKATR